MKAWAIVFRSDDRDFICIAFAETQAHANGEGFVLLGNYLEKLNKDNPDKDKWTDEHIEDFKPVLFTSREIPYPIDPLAPQKPLNTSVPSSSFDEQISQTRVD